MASHDLDLRGAGNLLGEEQSGHIREVGIELYQQMLEDAVAAARAGVNAETASSAEWTPQINLGLPVMIPEEYVPDLTLRMSLYRRIADLREKEDIEGIGAELVDRFGPMPQEVKNLLQVVSVKALCRKAHVERIDAGIRGAVVTFRDSYPRIDRLVAFVNKYEHYTKLRPDGKLVYSKAWADQNLRVKGAITLLTALAGLVAA